MSVVGNGTNGNGAIMKLIVGGLGVLVGILFSFLLGRVTAVEGRLNSVAESTIEQRVRVELMKEGMDEMKTTLKEIKDESEATNRYLGLDVAGRTLRRNP